MVCLQIPLSWIRDIRKFATTNAVANALILYGLILCLWFALEESTEPLVLTSEGNHLGVTSNATSLPANEKYVDESNSSLYNVWQHLTHLSPFGDHWILFIGTSVLLFEGSITLLIPLQEAVLPNNTSSSGDNPPTLNDRERFPKVYPQVILCIQVFYFFFAVICWMSFGDDVNTVLTTSLPKGFLATTVQLAYSVAVLFTFPLQNYPALEIACHAIAERLRTKPPQCLHSPNSAMPQQQQQQPVLIVDNRQQLYVWLMKRDVIAAGLVCLLAMVAWTTMESLDKVVSLTGALIGIPIAFILPPMIHTQLMITSPSSGFTVQRQHQNNAVAILGAIAMILASVTTIYQWND